MLATGGNVRAPKCGWEIRSIASEPLLTAQLSIGCVSELVFVATDECAGGCGLSPGCLQLQIPRALRHARGIHLCPVLGQLLLCDQRLDARGRRRSSIVKCLP
jgi:hypothetical protein